MFNAFSVLCFLTHNFPLFALSYKGNTQKAKITVQVSQKKCHISFKNKYFLMNSTPNRTAIFFVTLCTVHFIGNIFHPINYINMRFL